MEEKSEQLRLTNSRLKALRRSTGQSIIDFFQGTNLNDEEENRIDNYYYSTESFEMLSDDEFQIEQILMEAGAYGLRSEVDHYAKRLLERNPLSSRVDAYVKAYHEIIKD
jgi:hypothetical protein